MQPPQRLHIAFAYDNGFVHAHPPLRRALDELAQALTLAGHDGVSKRSDSLLLAISTDD